MVASHGDDSEEKKQPVRVKKARPQRSLPLRQRQEVQKMLRAQRLTPLAKINEK
jgi:hypothetical protein